jgi:hypothetical protein
MTFTKRLLHHYPFLGRFVGISQKLNLFHLLVKYWLYFLVDFQLLIEKKKLLNISRVLKELVIFYHRN